MEAIRRFTEEHSGGGLPSTTISRPRGVIFPQRRRTASLEVTVRGPNRREVTYSASSVQSGTAPTQSMLPSPGPQTAATRRALAPPTNVPTSSMQRPPPSLRPPRPAKVGPPHWAIPMATSRHPVKRKKPPVVIQPPRPPRGQRRMEMKPRDPGDLVTFRFRLSWSIPVVLGILQIRKNKNNSRPPLPGRGHQGWALRSFPFGTLRSFPF